MKNIIIGMSFSGLLFFTACADFTPMEFEVEKPLSIEMQEEINAFPDLLKHLEEMNNPNFRLGVSLPMEDYTAKGVRYRLVNRNFNEFLPSTGMDHRSIVQANGSLNLVPVTVLLEDAREKEMNVYGSPLIWHRNQNSEYLNSLLAPLVVTSPAFKNELDISTLSRGVLDQWSFSPGVTFQQGQGMGSNTPAIRLIAGSAVNAPENLRFTSPSIPILAGKTYEVIAYIKSDQPGEGRFTFEGLNNNQPSLAWSGSGPATETFATSMSWREVRFRINDFAGNSFKLSLELGFKPGVTYFLDINNLYVYDIAGDPVITNLVSNGDFENGVAWGGWGNNSTRGVTAEGLGAGNSGRAFFVTNPTQVNFWGVQTLYQFPQPLAAGETFRLSFWVRGTAEGIIRPELQSPDFSSNGFGQVFVTRDWRFISVTTTATAATRNRFIISYGEFAGTVFIDQVVVANVRNTGGSTTIVEKTDVEKTSIISTQMENWIKGYVSPTKDKLKVREVISEPIHETDPTLIRTGVGVTPGVGEFYWQDYMGRDYGVRAFRLARENGNADDLLFISESGMETNPAKCEGLINYVGYIEQNGGIVDGISARVVLNLNSNMQNVTQMFTLLAASGKKIRISALEVRINEAQPSIISMINQAEMYKQVVKLYLSTIPANQQYGIAIAAPIDGTGEARAGLWASNLNRKHAYAGFSEGFAK